MAADEFELRIGPGGVHEIVEASANGGAQPDILQAIVTLSNADILALHTTPKTVVAGVAGFAIMPLTLVLVYHHGATSFSGTPGFQVFIGPSAAGAGWGGSGDIWGQNYFGQAASGAVGKDLSTTVEGDYEPFNLIDGQPFQVGLSSALTLGDGTAVVTVSYFLVPLT